MKRCLVTGSSGLIGSEVVTLFSQQGWEVHGIDNNMRREYFGPPGDTAWNRARSEKRFPWFRHYEVDIRDRSKVLELIQEIRPHAIIHTAAQPSHDLAASRPFDDFDVNAGVVRALLAVRFRQPARTRLHVKVGW